MTPRLYHYFVCCLLIACVVAVCLYKFTSLSVMRGLVGTGMVNKTTKELTSNVTFEMANRTNITARFIRRRLSVERKCVAPNLTRGYVKKVSGYTPAKLTLCIVPKAACTVWLRLFTFLMNKDWSNRSINDYSKYIVHYSPGKPYVKYNISGKDKAFVRTSIRAMTTRDPYTRLWSAYIDKLFLPDFWFGKGIQILRMVRPNVTSYAKRCGNDVTFPEFVQHVILVGHNMTYWGFDSHWLPVTDICDPCVFKPEFIVKQETFLSDFTRVVDTVGLLQAATPVLKNNQDEYEIKTEINYNFRRYHRISGCITKLGLAKRIWRAMKLNGYLQPDEEFPDKINEETIDQSTLVKMVLSARRRSGVNKKLKKAWRRRALVDAYQQLSEVQLKALQIYYRKDFDFFGYTRSPPV